MIKSMTGYGRAEAVFQRQKYCCRSEIRKSSFSGNIRCVYLQRFSLWSWSIKRKLAEKFKRGRIEVFIRLEGEGADVSKVNLNLEIARNYFNVLNRLKKEFDSAEAPLT